MLTIVLSTLLVTLPPRPVHPVRSGEMTVKVDSANRTVTLSAGPFRIEGSHAMPGMASHHGMHEGMEMPLRYFKWPVAGWTRGFELSLSDGQGRPIDRRYLHHLNIVNLGRRQLFYPVPERLLAIGQETPDIVLPRSVGVPLEAGWPMAMIIAWHNVKPEPVPEVYVTLVMHWSPPNLTPHPVSVIPVYLDVTDPVGRVVTFDLPAGRSTWHADLTLPASGRIIGIGGHAHDFVTDLALQEVTGGRVRTVSRLRTTLDREGRLLSVEQKLPGIRGAGIPLRRGGTYRITGSYNNRTGELLKEGAMLHIILLYAVDDMRQWPTLDPDDPSFRKDVEFLETQGGDGEAVPHEHGP